MLDKSSWDMPPVFTWLAEAGGVAEEEMHRTFNCGVGMTVIVGPAKAEAAIQLLTEQGLNCWELGRIEAGDGSVTFTPNKRALESVKYWKETSTGTVFANGSATDLNQVHKKCCHPHLWTWLQYGSLSGGKPPRFTQRHHRKGYQ